MRFSIKHKLMISTIIPILALLLFSLTHSQTQVVKIEHLESMQGSISTANTINQLMHNIQLERGLSTLYFYDKKSAIELLNKQRISTNQSIEDVIDLLQELKNNNDLKLVYKNLKSLINGFNNIDRIRSKITNRELSYQEFFQFYTDININLSKIITSLPIHSLDTELYFKASTFFNTILLEEAQGKERAIVAKISLKKTLYKEDDFHYLQIQVDKQILIESILKQNYYYSTSLKEEFKHYLNNPLSKELTLYLKPIIEYKMKLFLFHKEPNIDINKILILRQSLQNLDAYKWFKISSTHLNNLHNYDQKLFHTLFENLQQLKKYEERILIRQLLFTFIIIAFLLLFNRFIGHKILRSIIVLKEGTHDFFNYLNHKIDTPKEIFINSNDEFSDMSHEINTQISKLQERFDTDREFIMELTHIADLMSEGDFSEKIYFNATDPYLQKLKDVFNKLLNMIQQKIDAQNQELQLINNSLETQVFEQTLTLEKNLKELSAFKLAIDESLMFMKVDIEVGILDINEAMLQKFVYKKEDMLHHPPQNFLSSDYIESTRENVLSVVKKKKVYNGVIGWLDAQGNEFFTDAHIIPILKRNEEVDYLLALFHDITPIIHARDEAIRAEKSKDEFLSNMSHEIRTPLNAILGFVGILQKRSLDEKSLHYLDIINSSSNSLLGIINDILDFSKIQSGKFFIETRPFSPVQVISNALLLFASKAYEKEIQVLSYIDPNMPAALLGDEVRIKQVLSNFLSNALKFSPQNSSIRLYAEYKAGALNVAVKDEGIGIDAKNQERVFKAFEQADGSTTRQYGGTGLGLSISAHLIELMNGKIALRSKLNEGSTFSFEIPQDISDALSAQETHIEKIKQLSITILEDKNHSALSDLLEKYFKDYGVINFSKQDNLENLKGDLLIFTADPSVNETVQTLQIPSIALHTHPTHIFDNNPHIYNLVAPLVPRLVLEALDDATIERLRIEQEVEVVEELFFEARVLVAEDNKTNQMLITLLLEDYGIDFQVADDGDIAVEIIKKDHNFDLILMDENMPNLNGLSAMKQINSYLNEQYFSSIPIVALTANAMQGDRERFIKEGMDDFITKPIENTELERIFKKYLRPKAS